MVVSLARPFREANALYYLLYFQGNRRRKTAHHEGHHEVVPNSQFSGTLAAIGVMKIPLK